MPEGPLSAEPAVTRFVAPYFRCVVRDSAAKDAAWICATGELDMAGAPLLGKALRDTEACARRVVDLREVTFMDCAGLRVIVRARDQSDSTAGRLAVIRGPTQVDRLFSLTGTASLLEIIDFSASEPLVQECFES